MKTLSRILSICLFSAPLFSAVADGPVATTAGHNLTAYHPSDAYNNQWATASNGRSDSAVTAKADFGNCNAVILRCAQPKCGNGGCSDMNVAANIVYGCVQANETCKQYGNDLVNYMAAQLVATSNSKINAQQAQIAQQQQAQQQQQMYDMQSQMQQQMAQMQQQMAEQNALTQQQIESALAQQQAQQQAALANITAAAETAAKERESGVSAYQEDAISRGVSSDVLRRKQIAGQIMTDIENAEITLKEVKTAMQDTFDYAGCDSRGNNCTGPKRVKRFRERATNFIDPYEGVIEKISEALDNAAIVGGIDMSDIYMMLNNSCKRWMQYMCPPGEIQYSESTSNGVARLTNPQSCPSFTDKEREIVNKQCDAFNNDLEKYWECQEKARKSLNGKKCKPCTPLKVLTEENDIYEGWVNAEIDNGDENITVVACGDEGMISNNLLGSSMKRKMSGGTISIDQLSVWLSQVEPSVKPSNFDGKKGYEVKMEDVIKNYCYNDKQESALRAASLSKSLDLKKFPLCVKEQGTVTKGNTYSDALKSMAEMYDAENGTPEMAAALRAAADMNIDADDGECSYISPVYGLCDVHVYNIGEDVNPKESSRQAEIKDMISLKTTVITQQMYRQYEYLSATLRRLKTQLEKAVLTSTLEAAGAKKDSSSSSSGGLAGAGRDDDKAIYLAGAENCLNKMGTENVIQCIQSNISLVLSSAKSNSKKAAKQLVETIKAAQMYGIAPCSGRDEKGACKPDDKCIGTSISTSNVQICAQELMAAVAYYKDQKEEKKQSTGLLRFVQ